MHKRVLHAADEGLSPTTYFPSATRINVGCGRTPTAGWRNFDNSISLRVAKIPMLPSLLHVAGMLSREQYEYICFARTNRIEYGDVTKGLPLAAGSVDVLYGSHVLEHLDRAEASLFLNEARRVLRPDGIIRLVLPDLRKQIQKYIDSGDADAFVEGTFLWSCRPRTIGQRMCVLLTGTRNHHWMYDDDSLRRLLGAHDFIDPTIMPAGQTDIEAPGLLDLHERAAQSIYVEARAPGTNSK